VPGTKAETVIEVLRKIPRSKRKKVTEVTLDMAGSIGLIVKQCFPNSVQVTDRFHVSLTSCIDLTCLLEVFQKGSRLNKEP